MKFNLFTALVLSCFLFGCKEKNKQEETPWRTKKMAVENEVQNQLLDIEKEQGWQLLFDGKTLDGWHLYNNADSTAHSAWEVKDGMLYCNATDESRTRGDLITDRAFEDYEFTFEWKIASNGNSGIFVNVQERPEILNTYHSGPEYQLLGQSHMDYNVDTKRPGCLYGFLPQQNTVEIKPSGEWNTSTIKQKDGKMEFYLNGVQTATQDFTTDAWKKQVSGSGFAERPEFGKHTQGKIALQNWFFDVWFRNMKIREL